MNDLRASLERLVADVELPPGLVHDVEQGARSWTWPAVAGVAVPVVLIGAAVVVVPHGNRPKPPSTVTSSPSSALAEVDGVAVTYLPSGFTQGRTVHGQRLNNPGRDATTTDFTDGTRSFAVSVQRGPVEDLDHLVDVLAASDFIGTERVTVAGHPALLCNRLPGHTGPTFVDVAAGPDLTLSVAADPSMLDEAELLRIAGGLHD